MQKASNRSGSAPRLLAAGEAAPWFQAATVGGQARYAFHTVAGRHVLLLFFGSSLWPGAADALAAVESARALLDDHSACFFGVTVDPGDAAEGRVAPSLPGIRFFLDHDRQVSALYGAADGDTYRPHWLLLDPSLRVIGRFAVQQAEQAIAALRACLAAPAGDQWAPVLRVPNLFEPDVCAELVRRYDAEGGESSGFMREVDGKTVLVHDPHHKQRRDWEIQDQALIDQLLVRVRLRLTVPIERAFQFTPTRIERHLVACYEAGHGHFRPHRDNTTKGTAHRRFAVTINLNDDYDGGDLRFPEFGARTYRAPVGGAVVFSCSLLHEATPVTRGRRFAYLPFLYDEAAAQLREANSRYLGEGLGVYASGEVKAVAPAG